MKNIELTEEHKSKLLEMCKELFTEYDFRINKPLFCNNESLSTIQLGNKNVNIYENEIHWFEFVTIHLINKIRDLLLKQGLINIGSSDSPWQVKQLLSAYYSVNYHPIDYLYEEFKKLK